MNLHKKILYVNLNLDTPILLIPIQDNQKGNAEKLITIGIGMILNQFQLNLKEIILDNINLILKDNQIKKNIKRLENLTKINNNKKKILYKSVDLIEYI